MIEIRLPQFGMGMSDGTIIKWHKAEGDRVEKGELLCDIEAAKTTVEFESPESGILSKIAVAVDQNVPVNTVIAQFDSAGSSASATAGEEAPEAGALTASTGAGAVRASPLARRYAEQNGVDLSAVSGTGPGGKVLHGDVKGEGASPSAVRPAVQIEPKARYLARERKVDLARVTGTGPGGRIVAEDVEAFAKAPAPASVEKTNMTAPAPRPAQTQSGSMAPETGDVEIPHSMMRRTIARRLTESKTMVPHFYLKASCRIDALLALRAQINEGADVKISVNDMVVRAVALALKAVPDANVAWGEKAVTKFAHVDVAVAVATPRGLVTPIVRQVDTKPIRQIAAEIKELATRGKEGKLKPEEYQGGNTSVSNLGMFGVEEFSAILNPPQSSIFAIGAGEERAVVVDGKVTVATMMNVTISVDHRAVDGAVGAQMLAAFKKLIETPARILA
ncbi:pyruvate dehydrogenase E2 component (dihydrolipoamide acetyltransferase) [Sphingobium faniae]|nr:pyruvate dehydrogenase E2 component (dihydrolipoamide acetyltransferase) [Sphingobium faniae]